MRFDASVEITDKGARYKKAMREAVPRALYAAAQVYRNEVVKRLRQGYTSGAFVTGRSRGSVRTDSAADVRWDLQGAYLRVGTNVPYMLFWEIGHINLFTRKFERVEVWVPALAATKEAQGEAFARVLDKLITNKVDGP